MAELTRIAMWSGPRNISTAMMRSFENRPDTVVEDEPFYAHYLIKTGVNHPYRIDTIESQENDWEKVSNRLVSEIPNGTIWYQKHMCQHNLEGCDLTWTKKLVNCFLIRDPKEVISSFTKQFKLTSSAQLGFTQQLYLFEKLKNETGQAPIVVNSRDVLKNPRKTLSMLCEKIGIPFVDEMLSWPLGPRKSDGVWAKHWYPSVMNSTSFKPETNNSIKLSDNEKRIVELAMPIYEELYKRAI